VDSVVSDPEDLLQEKQHINKALHECGYPTWAINKALQPPKKGTSSPGRGRASERTTVTIPYVKGRMEKIKRVKQVLHPQKEKNLIQLIVGLSLKFNHWLSK